MAGTKSSGNNDLLGNILLFKYQ